MPKKKKKVAPKEPEFTAKRVRVLFSGANKDRCYIAGKSYRVPEEVSVDTAKGWLKAGKAELDKAGEGPSETK